MERIEDCFAKFFLRQASEIEPETIQSLIDHGYRSKLSLTAMDLKLDLPLIEEIPLSQRSLLRKYIGALQENQPFSVTLVNEKQSSSDEYYHNVPIKKRKYDCYIADQSFNSIQPSDSDFIVNTKSIASKELIIARKESNRITPESSKTISRSATFISSPSNSRTSKRSNQFWSSENDEMNILTNGTKRIAQDEQVVQEQKMDDEDQNDVDQINQSMVVEDTSITPNKRGRGRKSTTVRTPSQIRYEMLKNLNNTNLDIDDSNEKQANTSMNVSISGRRTGRKSNVAVRTTSQIHFEKLKQGLKTFDGLESRIDLSPQQTEQETTSTKTSGKVLTPAEREVMAKIEAKKQALLEKKTPRSRRGRK